MNNKIKAIIFDMDGVLIDAKKWHYDSLNFALKPYGLFINKKDQLNIFEGLPTSVKLNILTEQKGLLKTYHDLIKNDKQKKTIEIVHKKCKPFNLHHTALSNLKRDGYKLVVCSNSIRESIELMMQKSKLIDYLDFFLSNQDVVNAKPNPEIYKKAFSMLGLYANECLVLEDSEHGTTAALNSGAHLLKINSIHEVNYENILNKIKEIENY